jgi:sugar phosphate isomerase/epimerase
MKLAIGKTLWGVDASPFNWDAVFGRIKQEGYEAIECVPAFSLQSDPVLFKELLHKHDLKLIVQVHTNGGYFKDGAYVYCLNCDMEQHLTSFRSQVQEALEMGAVLINCHSGHDSWSLDTAVAYFKAALEIEATFMKNPAYSNTTIVHETHRQRLMYSPFQTRDILKQPELKDLKINADLSHWVCVCERVFDMTDPRDASVIIEFVHIANMPGVQA